MGTINYKTSKFISVGYNLKDIDYNNDDYYYDIEDSYDNISSILSKENYKIFEVSIHGGYYEGFYIDINFDYCYFDDYLEKKDALKELTKIKKFLLFCINNFNCCVCYNGWVNTYLDCKESRKKLSDAIKKARLFIKNIPTYKNYNFSYNYWWGIKWINTKDKNKTHATGLFNGN